MRGSRARRRGQERARTAREAALLAAAVADVTCTACQRTFEGGTAAFTIHVDRGQCLAGDCLGQLAQLRDGRWTERWRVAGRATRGS